jgi:hypothetical protein
MAERQILCAALALGLIPMAVGQNSSFTDISRFTKSATEHEIVVVHEVFSVRSVVGTISFSNHPVEPLTDVLIEILGPGNVNQVRRAMSDQNGRFKISSVPEGAYRFKATRNGFSSIVGTVTVSRRADKTARIHLDMPIGN